MTKNAIIISDDVRFSRMLALELTDLGVEIVSDMNAGEIIQYIIADLDCCSADELKSYSMKSTVIGFSKLYEDNINVKAEHCQILLHRPFPIAALTDIFVSSDTSHVQRRSSSVPKKKKTDYLTVDPVEKAAIWGDSRIYLSDNEFKVLSLLCENRGETVEREKIYSLLGAEEGNMGDVYICHLRRKIDNKLGLKLIYTIRGKGYMLKN